MSVPNPIAEALRQLYAPSPAERIARLEYGLTRAIEQLPGLRLGEPGAADRVEILAGQLGALQREARALLLTPQAVGGV